ncbi:MAG: DPP IV N-terminal domain-containing protein [Prevotellaceae bacterium]|nr:DPP IV N-terminal domain-containing protein [Prevotellaceae bacterium]
MRINRFVILFLTLLTPMMIQAQDKKLFTLEDLNFGGTNYRNMRPESRFTEWWGDELIHLDVEEVSIINKVKGDEKSLFTLFDINQWAGLTGADMLRSVLYARFPYADKPYVLVTNGKKRMLVDFKAKKLVWSQENDGSLEWNAASKADAYLDGGNLFVRTADGKTTQLSTDGSREIVYGQSVHRNEFGIEKGTFWSEDGRKLAFYRMDQSMVEDYPQVDLFQREAEHAPDKYPMAGMTSHKVTIGVYDIDSQKTIYLNAGDPTDRYFTNIQWSPDGKSIYLFELNRDQNNCTLDEYSAETGEKLRTLYTEKDDKYVEPLHPVSFLPWDSQKFLMWSQKDGFMHLYVGNATGDISLRQLTKGNFVVDEILGFCTKTKSVIIKSNELNPLQMNIWSVNIETGKRTLLDNGKGVHRGSLSESGLYVSDTYSEPTVPRNIDILSTTKNKQVRYLTSRNPWDGYQVPEFLNGSIKAADGVTDLYWRMVRPADFDPNKKYPTVVYVYGGPHAHNVDASWNWASRSWETYMAQKGYIVFILDNRGSENRGKEFEQVTFRHLGQEEMKDQMCGVNYLKSLPYVDADRLGVHGWSFGGFMTISLITNYPDVFKVGVAGGPVIDWQWYEVMYGERYMDTPQTNPEGYKQTSLLDKAKNLKGRLLIITGMNDATVVPQNCLMFLNACAEEGTQPDFFAYPGEEHNMKGHKSVHLHEKITRYFEDFLK